MGVCECTKEKKEKNKKFQIEKGKKKFQELVKNSIIRKTRLKRINENDKWQMRILKRGGEEKNRNRKNRTF